MTPEAGPEQTQNLPAAELAGPASELGEMKAGCSRATQSRVFVTAAPTGCDMHGADVEALIFLKYFIYAASCCLYFHILLHTRLFSPLTCRHRAAEMRFYQLGRSLMGMPTARLSPSAANATVTELGKRTEFHPPGCLTAF